MLMVCHHLDSPNPGRRRLRRKPHPPRDHRRRGHPARPRGVLDDRLRQPGHGPGRRGHPAHLADRRQDEEAARTAAGGVRRQRQPAGASATSPSTPSTRRIAHGIAAQHIGSVEIGKLRRPGAVEAGLFRRQAGNGAEGGTIALRPQMGDPNASIPTPQPVHYRGRCSAPSARRSDRTRGHLRLPSRRGGRPTCRPASAWRRRSACRSPAPAAASARGHDPERCDRRRSRSTRKPTKSGPTANLLTCEPAEELADGAAVFPVLMLSRACTALSLLQRVASDRGNSGRHGHAGF